ncbi:hypothetical protein QAD02_022528 [Eretmocerus hayati]|uniref:Uncharacterized protein n=1 Tax=Eretmocerus hayati TaxID=131215 RepID=A0ACC2PVS5_9HYME|nr:hypothetical protein QAD02_022528 [Eretmocerus hayati]
MVESDSNLDEKEAPCQVQDTVVVQDDEITNQIGEKRKRDASPEIRDDESSKKICPTDDDEVTDQVGDKRKRDASPEIRDDESSKKLCAIEDDEVTDQVGDKRKRDGSPKGRDDESSKKFCAINGSNDDSKIQAPASSNDEGSDENEVSPDKLTEATRDSNSKNESENDIEGSANVTEENGFDKQKEKENLNSNILTESNGDATADDANTDGVSKPVEKDIPEKPKETLGPMTDSAKKDDDPQSNVLEADKTKENSINTDVSKEPDEAGSPDKKKSRKIDSEVINGVELIVECASDQESSDESEHVDPSPRKKTIIVREKPHDSEFEEHCSEDENSDSYQVLESKSKGDEQSNSPTDTNKNKKPNEVSKTCTVTEKSKDRSKTQSNKGGSSVPAKDMKSSHLTKGKDLNRVQDTKRKRNVRDRSWEEDEEEYSNPETSDEEWSSRKRRTRKTRTRKNSRAGNDRKRDVPSRVKSKNPPKEEVNVESDDDLQIEYSNIVPEGKRKSETQPTGKIDMFKNFIRAAGLKIKSYETFLAGCRTESVKVERLSQFLQKSGIKGRPTLQKCIKFKEDNENSSKATELDTRKIITDTRVTRGRRSQKFNQDSEESPARGLRTPAKKMRIVDDDSD